jgi:hypothetical protein
MGTLIKTTEDGRRVEVVGLGVMLDGRLESIEITDIMNHPRRLQILSRAPEATHVAGRITLTREEADRAKTVLSENQARAARNPAVVMARFQAALHQRAWEQGIE